VTETGEQGPDGDDDASGDAGLLLTDGKVTPGQILKTDAPHLNAELAARLATKEGGPDYAKRLDAMGLLSENGNAGRGAAGRIDASAISGGVARRGNVSPTKPVTPIDDHSRDRVMRNAAEKNDINNDKNNGTKFAYKNNPMDDPKAAKDIVENPNAVYGYSPNPQSEKIGKFAEFDWANEDVVSRAREVRLQYHNNNESIYNLVQEMQHTGASLEEIARAANQQRNLNRLQIYIDAGNMNGYEKAVESNIKNFQNKLGMTAAQAYEKYGSWDIVLEKAMSANAGMDACCGL
jgi:hypothetical protein